MLREQQAQSQGLGLDLCLDKAGSPVVHGRGGRRPGRNNRDPVDGTKNCGRLKKVKEGSKERSEVQVERGTYRR